MTLFESQWLCKSYCTASFLRGIKGNERKETSAPMINFEAHLSAFQGLVIESFIYLFIYLFIYFTTHYLQRKNNNKSNYVTTIRRLKGH